MRRVAADEIKTSVKELMSHSVVSGDVRQTLVEAAGVMRQHRVGALAVLQDDQIIGIITERDLMRAVADGQNPEWTHVSQYMTHSPKTIEAAERAMHAAETMIKFKVRHLPVTEDGKLVGFLSARDLLALKPWPNELPIGEPW